MMKKLAAVITIIVLLLVLSPVYAQEGTPLTETPTPEEVPPTEETPIPEEGIPAETPLPEGTPPIEETSASEETPPTEETPAPEEETPAETDPSVETRPSSADFLVDISLPDEIGCDLNVIVQRDDWLSKLAEKFYGDILAFPVIFATTNAKFVKDDTYAFIEDPDLIEIGWKLCIVGVEVAEQILGFELESAPLVDDTPQNLDGIIKVGAVHALTGPLTRMGQSIRNGIAMAVKEINGRAFLGAGTLEIIWEDTFGGKEHAINAFNKLINEDNVVAIFGPTLSRSAFAAAPLAQEAGVPVIGSSNTAGGITNIGNYIFRTNLPEGVVIRHTIRRTKELLGLEKVIVIYDNSDPFTKSNLNAFEQALSDEGVEVGATVALTNNNTDFLAQLSKLQALGPDAIVLNVLGREAADIILQARRLGISDEIRFIGGNSFNSSAFFDLGGKVVNGTVSGAVWNMNIVSGSNRKFVADYEAEYGSRPDQFAAQSYTAVWALATALRSADSTDRAAIRDALDTMDLIESPLGLFTFDDDRNPDHSPIIQVANDGAFVVFQ